LQEPPKLPRDKKADVHVGRGTIGQINADTLHQLIGQIIRQTGAPLGLKPFDAGHDRMRWHAMIW
jgi:hypothetical protein